MAFIPHTPDDITGMLDVVGARSIEELFDEIPAELRAGTLKVPPPLSEIGDCAPDVGSGRARRPAPEFHRRRRV